MSLFKIQPEPFTRDDLPRICHLQPEGWSDIRPHIAYYLDHSFCYPLKTEHEGVITGMGALILLGETAWIAHIIVDQAFRNRGIGGAIVNTLVDLADRKGAVSCSLTATELGRPVYVRAGFTDVGEYTFYERKSEVIKGTPSSFIKEFHESFRRKILLMDKEISGEDRRRVMEPCLPDASLYVKEGQLHGYYVPGVKEGPIVAVTDEAGLALMGLKYQQINKAVLPAVNRTGAHWLLDQGFIAASIKGLRMVRGKEIDWHPEKIFSRIGGNLG